jgi:hypothetical protein
MKATGSDYLGHLSSPVSPPDNGVKEVGSSWAALSKELTGGLGELVSGLLFGRLLFLVICVERTNP